MAQPINHDSADDLMLRGSRRQEFLEQQPTYWLKRCYQALRRTVDCELRGHGISLSQRDALLTLFHDGPASQSDLCERLGLEQSTVSRLVDGLVQRRLVDLRPDETDRRARIARLTEEGKLLLARTPGSTFIAGECMTAGLSATERADLVRLLRHCTANLSPDGLPASIPRPPHNDDSDPEVRQGELYDTDGADS